MVINYQTHEAETTVKQSFLIDLSELLTIILKSMKRIILLFAVLFYLASGAFAGSKELFSIDKEMIRSELSGLSDLENYVKVSNATFSNLKSENNALVANVSGNNFTSLTSMGDPPLGISSFIWGFLFWRPRSGCCIYCNRRQR
jgi:hypothetical protein